MWPPTRPAHAMLSSHDSFPSSSNPYDPPRPSGTKPLDLGQLVLEVVPVVHDDLCPALPQPPLHLVLVVGRVRPHVPDDGDAGPRGAERAAPAVLDGHALGRRPA